MAQIVRVVLEIELPDTQPADVPDVVQRLEADWVVQYINSTAAGLQEMMSVERNERVGYEVRIETVETKIFAH